MSVVVTGTYLELGEPQYQISVNMPGTTLAVHPHWRNPLAERREHTSDLAIEPLFFRIDIMSMTGLRGIPKAEYGGIIPRRCLYPVGRMSLEEARARTYGIWL